MPGRYEGCRTFVQIPNHGEFPADMGTPDDEGRCEAGQEPILTHRGFDYLGRSLAKQGYVTVSIDPLMINRASGTELDTTLNAARARLILRTLEKVRDWDSDSTRSMDVLKFDLSNTVDFSEIGLMGHSRGGGGVRLAANMLMTPERLPVRELYDWGKLECRISGVIEVSPVWKRELGVKTTVIGPAWALVAAGCDDDLWGYRTLLIDVAMNLVDEKLQRFSTLQIDNHD